VKRLAEQKRLNEIARIVKDQNYNPYYDLEENKKQVTVNNISKNKYKKNKVGKK